MKAFTCTLALVLIAALGLCGLSIWGCGNSAGSCRDQGKCECAQKSDCPEGVDCINGKCQKLTGPAVKKNFADPCLADDECRSTHCLPLGPSNGGVCTQECSDQACPAGWDCRTEVPDQGSPIALCVQHIEAKLCQACAVSSQCNAIGDLCVEVAGAFVCARDCSLASCPQGYSCTDVTVGSATAKQCLPTGGSCECNQATVGLTRSCHTTNNSGTCYGQQTCTAGSPQPAWSDCDAREPKPEVCNGIDDDCDGLTDDQDPSVDTSSLPKDPPYPSCQKGVAGSSCVGRWACARDASGSFGWSCVAADPKQEVCNGLDDDCDGLTDEDFKDSQGRAVGLENCGACGINCKVEVLHLRRDNQGKVVDGAVACLVRGDVPTCVPQLCEPGFYPYPEGAPVTCADLVSPACQPCSTDADCRISTDRCLTVGDDPGMFCSQSCDPTSYYTGCTGETGVQSCCPEHYLCQQVSGTLLCLPAAGSCTCNQDKVGQTRPCFLQGSDHTCQGLQTCQATPPDSYSWTPCEPSSVVVEICDYVDNNCNGQIDEGFVNADGKYYTDQNCHACNHNCLAQWSQSIQHAIGGCVPIGDDFDCRIVACTTEQVAVEDGCHSDSDCLPGLYCSPIYHHCLWANPADCPNGNCGFPCSSDSDCQVAFGSSSRCIGSVCQVEFDFVNLNNQDADGCECASEPAAGPDAPDTFSAYPQPGIAYVDSNCDGVDGEAAYALFVWSGSQSSQGTRENPYKTIAEALAAFDPTVHKYILVASGRYQENVVLRPGVKLYGGYSSDFHQRDVVLFPVILQGNEPDPGDPNARSGTVNAEAITALDTVLAGFTILGYDVNSVPGSGQPGYNSYAIYVKDSDASLRILNNAILAGRGGDGADGSPGASGQSGSAGGRGQDTWECPNSPDCFGLTRAGGTAGTNPGCASAAGHPGATARDYNHNPQDYPGNGIDGQGGSNNIYTTQNTSSPDPNFHKLCKYDCQVDTSAGSDNGLDGHSGGDGLAGNGGAGCAQGLGSISGGQWRASGAGTGATGWAGNAGGGGGAGGAVRNDNFGNGCTIGNPWGDLGASGGGGGAGGCGANGGAAAGGGGGSFGILITFSSSPASLPQIVGNRIRRGFGGFGGAGGGGGQGGLGGPGGDGGDILLPAWCAGGGGHGGRGGDGGAGGGGGGGCGGVSYGIGGNFLGGNPFSSQNTFEAPGTPNSGGAGGPGGPSPAGSTQAGTPGSSGSSGDVGEF